MSELMTGQDVADAWVDWCGDNQWTGAMRRFGELGGRVKWFDGYPQSRSAIPLTFILYSPEGQLLYGYSRLRDIKDAIKIIKEGL